MPTHSSHTRKLLHPGNQHCIQWIERRKKIFPLRCTFPSLQLPEIVISERTTDLKTARIQSNQTPGQFLKNKSIFYLRDISPAGRWSFGFPSSRRTSPRPGQWPTPARSPRGAGPGPGTPGPSLAAHPYSSTRLSNSVYSFFPSSSCEWLRVADGQQLCKATAHVSSGGVRTCERAFPSPTRAVRSKARLCLEYPAATPRAKHLTRTHTLVVYSSSETCCLMVGRNREMHPGRFKAGLRCDNIF